MRQILTNVQANNVANFHVSSPFMVFISFLEQNLTTDSQNRHPFMHRKPPKVEDFVQIRLFVYFGTKSSTFGAFFLKILHFWLRKLEKPPLWEFFFFLLDFLSKLEKPPLLVVFFSKVRISFRIDFQSSTFGGFFSPKSSTFGYENLDF